MTKRLRRTRHSLGQSAASDCYKSSRLDAEARLEFLAGRAARVIGVRRHATLAALRLRVEGKPEFFQFVFDDGGFHGHEIAARRKPVGGVALGFHAPQLIADPMREPDLERARRYAPRAGRNRHILLLETRRFGREGHDDQVIKVMRRLDIRRQAENTYRMAPLAAVSIHILESQN